MTGPLWVLAIIAIGIGLYFTVHAPHAEFEAPGWLTPSAIAVALVGHPARLADLSAARRSAPTCWPRRSRRSATRRSRSSGSTTSSSAIYRYVLLTFSRARRLDRSLPRRRRPERRQRVDARRRRPAAADADRQGAGLRLGRRLRPAGADGVDRSRLVSGLPVLSIITWSPFVAALVIMAFARHRPLLVRLDGGRRRRRPARARRSGCASPYDRAAAGFQFAESLRAGAVVRHLVQPRASTAWASCSCC